MSAELIRLLAELSVVYPEMRLGQLVEMLGAFAEDGPETEDRDTRLLRDGAAHLIRRLDQLGMSEESLGGSTLTAARADLLAALKAAGPGLESVLAGWAARSGARLYDAEDGELLAAVRPPIRLSDWASQQAAVAG